MPLLRCFTYVGGALLALLIVAGYVVPDAPTPPAHDASKPVIRIASNRVVGPPRVDFDTSVQTVPGPVALLVGPRAPRPPAREAMAQLAPPQPAAATAPPATASKIEHRKTRIARRPDRRLVAAYPQPFQPFRWTW
jgi:hypothetical protein